MPSLLYHNNTMTYIYVPKNFPLRGSSTLAADGDRTIGTTTPMAVTCPQQSHRLVGGWAECPTGDRTMSTNEHEPVVCTFAYLRKSKNTYRYDETGEIPKIGGLYIQKFALGVPAPETLKVTVEVM